VSASRASYLGYTPAFVDPTLRLSGALDALANPGQINAYTGTLNVPHTTSPWVKAVVGAGIGYGLASAAGAALGTTVTLPSTTSPLSTLTAPDYSETPPPETPVSIFSTLNEAVGFIGNAANLYRQYDASKGGVSVMPSSLAPGIVSPMTLAALPAIGAGAAAIGGAAVRLGVAGARAVASSAMTYCRRHPQWCAGIGGSAAVAALIDSGQLPKIKRRRGRGLTPKDLRSFKRVANLIRVFAPTVRRIPARATRTGAHKHG